MGSDRLTTTLEQLGQISLNPTGLSPSSSRPIEQRTAVPATSSEPIEQRTGLTTDAVASNPVEQRKPDSFNEDGTSPDDCFIEQRNLSRSSTGPDSPIEQLTFVTSNSRLEQRDLIRDAIGDEPIEQQEIPSTSLDIEQFDFIESILPPCNSVKNAITSSIVWRIKDFGDEFAPATIEFYVSGVAVQDTSEFSVLDIANGLVLTYDPPTPFDFGITVDIVLFISDTAAPPNDFEYHCSWDTAEDTISPVISLLNPLCDATAVGVQENVVFSVFDFAGGVNEDSITLSIEGIPVCSGLSLEPFTTSSGNGFTGTWAHTDTPFRYNSNVSVAIEADDLADVTNSTLFICCFETGQSTIPEFMNFDPLECASFVDNITGLTFEVYGDIDGLDISTLEVRIDNTLRKVFIRPRILRSE